uniref:Uncharacterized protein n=1 Tax=Phenylobacterium glaciei TaxID=2803784 RepID=A0A974S9A6_9CAUL|nr:hypothetical protein JKL49_04175 [Phenylobacterium glaciei]
MTSRTNIGAEEEAQEQALRDSGKAALDDRRFKDAFQDFTASVLNQSIRWFREEGVTFTKPAGDITPSELILGLASAAEEVCRERGDDVSNKLATANWMFTAIADLRTALDEPVPLEGEPITVKMAEVIVRAMLVGQIDMVMTATRLGWADKLDALQTDRKGRKAGALATNAKRATIKEQALAKAIQIVGTNPTLSHEEVGKSRRFVEARKIDQDHDELGSGMAPEGISAGVG